MTTLKDKLSNMTQEELVAYALGQAEQAQAKVTLKISRKGGISVYGVGKFPVTLYRSQWLAVVQADVGGFLERHDAEITAAEDRWNSLTPAQQTAEDAENAPTIRAKKPVSGKAALVAAIAGE